MQELLRRNVQAYAVRHQLQLTEQLGFGIHGIVHVAKDNIKAGKTAIKAHNSVEPYCRERDVYLRLRDAGITQITGLQVPRLVRFDDELRIIEMTVVTRPFVLDFAGAYLDIPPDFADEVWAQWEEDKREQFGSRWPDVLNVLAALEELEIHMIDVSPSNVAL
jgi:hypothetical protein